MFQFVVIHTVKGLSVVNEAELYVFLKFSCFFYDLMDVGNLMSVSSAFSKSSLYIWKFSVHIWLKSSSRDQPSSVLFMATMDTGRQADLAIKK